MVSTATALELQGLLTLQAVSPLGSAVSAVHPLPAHIARSPAVLAVFALQQLVLGDLGAVGAVLLEHSTVPAGLLVLRRLAGLAFAHPIIAVVADGNLVPALIACGLAFAQEAG